MKNNAILLIAILFIVFTGQGKAQNTFSPVWQIGKNDGSAAEFQYYNSDYQNYKSRYADGTVLYEIGKSKESEIPYFIPGKSDAWAGGQSGQMIIRFGAKKIQPSTNAKLRINFVETHSSANPLLQINLNDFETKVRTPRGSNQNFLNNKKTDSKNLFVEVEIPSGKIREGDNTLIISNVAGSWVVLDNIMLTADHPVEPGKSSGAMMLLSAESIPALAYGKSNDLNHPVKLQIANWYDKMQEVEVKIDSRTVSKPRLKKGVNQVEVYVPETTTEKDVNIQLLSKSKVIAERNIKISPVKKWTVYLVQHTHTDIGYTKPQTEILAEHLRYIDYVIEYCELSSGMPDDAKFRWTCEAAWAVEEYLKIRPKEQIEKLKKYIDNGQIEVTGMFFNMSEIVDENSFKTFLEPFREFRKNGIPVKTAMQNDVNGIAWCLADYLPDLGVEYVWMGEHGHRALIPFDKPTVFRWESPSGKPVYAYRADHYMTANFWGIEHGSLDNFRSKMIDYLQNLESKDYPFDAVGVQYSGYSTDNSPPSLQESKLIEEWNQIYAYPKLRSALPSEFMDYIVEKHKNELETYRVAYPDWWTDGFGSAARETAASRETHADMVTVEGLLSMAAMNGSALPENIDGQIRHIHENLLFYDEHTFGASESISDPMCENSQVQWAEKSAYVWEGLKKTQMMYETSVGLLQNELKRGIHPTITFFNTFNWERSEVMTMYIDFEVIPRDKSFRIVDENGYELKVQPVKSRSEGRYYTIYAENIPAMGYKTYEIIVDKETNADTNKNIPVKDQIENDYYRIKLDTEKGAIESLYDKQLQTELVDAGSPWLLGAFVYEELANRHQMERYTLTDYERSGLSNCRIIGLSDGDIYQSIQLEGNSACCDNAFGVKVEIQLYHNTKRIEMVYAVKRLPETAPTGIYVAFPFSLDNAKLSFEVQGGLLTSGENQLTGTASDWNTVQNFVTANNGNAQIIVGSNTVPLFQMGGITTGLYQYQKKYEKPHVYSWVMNNYWTTNFRAFQEGEFRWNYYLTSSADASMGKAAKFGWSSRIPLYARVMPTGKPNNKAAEYSYFTFGSGDLLMTSCTPSEEQGYVLLNVRELNGRDALLKIFDSKGNQLSFSIVNVIEEPLQSGLRENTFKPFENKFIKLKL